MAATETIPDFIVTNEHSFFLVSPQTPAAEAHLDEVLDPENSTRWCGGVAVEGRYVEDFVARLDADGFTVRGRR
jgi:hypothetical protein